VKDTEPDQLLESWRNPQQPPLTDDERRRVRQMLQDDDRATWLRKQVRIITPWLVTVVATAYGVFTWVSAHWKSPS
jgi:hypothetical protein